MQASLRRCCVTIVVAALALHHKHCCIAVSLPWSSQRWQCKQHCIAAALPHEKRIWHRVTVVSPSLLWCWQHKNPAVFGPALGTMTPTMTATATGYGGGSSPHKQQNKNNNHNSGRNRTVTATRHCCDKASAVAVAAQQRQ